jgi:hypothetical protein
VRFFRLHRVLRLTGVASLATSLLVCGACPRAKANETAGDSPSERADGSPTSQVYRSPSIAFQLSLFSTLGPLAAGTGLLYASQGHSGSSQTGAIAAFALGLSIAPAAGHLYAGEYGHALLTTTVRVAAGTLAMWVFVNSIPKDCSPGQCHTEFGSEGPVLALFLALLVPATAVNDIADAPHAAHRANKRHDLELGLVPVVGLGGRAPFRGLALSGYWP